MLDFHALPQFVTESAHSRALFFDTVLRPVGGWGVERWVPPVLSPRDGCEIIIPR